MNCSTPGFPVHHQLPAAAAAAKSLQSCPTLCDPIDGSPPGSPIPGILQARTLEWVAISFPSAWKWKVKVKSLSRVRLLATPWTSAYQAPPSMGFSRQEYWSGLPLPSPPTPGVYPNSCPLSRWCHSTISPSVIRFSSCLQSFPASGTFPMSPFFASGGQSIGVSASVSVLPMNIQDWVPLEFDWLDLLALQGILKSLLQQHSSKASIIRHSAFFIVQLSHPYMTTAKTIALTRWTFVGKVMSPLFNMLSRLVIAFLPRNKHLLISWLQSPFAVILELNKIKSVTISIVLPSICHKVMGSDAMNLTFWTLSFKPTFSLHSPLSLLSRGSSRLCFLPQGWYHLHEVTDFLLAILIPAFTFTQPNILHDVLCI